MQTIDYSKLIGSGSLEKIMPPGAALAQKIYQGLDGVQYGSQAENYRFVQDIVRLSDQAYLLAGNYLQIGEDLYHQVVCDSDWVHIQFRISGGGCEIVSQADVIKTPVKSCVIARYPKNSVVVRKHDNASHWTDACILVSPKGLTDLLDVSASKLPEGAVWMALEDELELQAALLPLQPAMVLAVNDILTCPFRGGNRRVYMRAKSLELLSTVIHALDTASAEDGRPGVNMSPSDLGKIARARSIMNEDLEGAMTLGDLARRVGLNRTKLALGFKEVYGTPVQAYWRDAKLNRARELLRDSSRLVTEVALSVGYSQISSFTRAFSRKFGVVPRACKGKARSTQIRKKI